MKNLLKIVVLLLTLSVVTACNQKSEVVTITGAPGVSGNNGNDGYSIVVKTVLNPEICGIAGGSTVYFALDLNRDLQFGDEDQVQTQYVTCNGRNGIDGQTGSIGTSGSNGLNGSSCVVNKVGNATTIVCGDSSAVVIDGINGAKGDTGLTGVTGSAGTNASGIYITSVINPCGVEFNNDEVFLKLSTGRILALYDGGANEDRLTLIAPGNYITTDRVQNKACAFTITSDYQVTNEHVQSPGNN